jgi:hypothetical protein
MNWPKPGNKRGRAAPATQHAFNFTVEGDFANGSDI